jgi:hypothetical protein
MNRKHLTHAAWFAVAAVTFALGWLVKPNSETSAVDSDRSRLELNSLPISGLPGDREAPPAGAVLGSELDAANAFVSTRPLESHEIEALGEDYRKALDPIAKRLAFSKLIAGMTADNALEIREQFDHLPAEHAAFRDFHYAWGKIAGDEAVLHGVDTKKPDMHVALAGFAAANPGAAMAWFDSLPKESSKEDYSSQAYLKMGMVHGLAVTDPDAAADFVLRFAGAGDRDARRMMAEVANKVMQSQGADVAADWTRSLPEGDMRNAATGHVAHRLAREDPQRAATWAQDVGSTRAMAAVGHEWAKQDGAAAVGWLDTMGDRADGTAYYHTFEAWVAKDPQAASQHLVDMSPSPNRDYAINGMINRHRWDDPQSAITWAGEIASPERRQRALVSAGEAFFRRNRAGAEQWLPTSGLPADVQQRLRANR